MKSKRVRLSRIAHLVTLLKSPDMASVIDEDDLAVPPRPLLHRSRKREVATIQEESIIRIGETDMNGDIDIITHEDHHQARQIHMTNMKGILAIVRGTVTIRRDRTAIHPRNETNAELRTP